MRFQWLAPLWAVIALATLLAGSEPVAAPHARDPVGYLALPGGEAGGCQSQLVPYHAQAGDILLYDDARAMFHFAYRLAGSGPPTHSALAYEREDGTPALLELVGPTVCSATVQLMEVSPRLNSYHGTIIIRRLRQPLCPEQKAALRDFAHAQEGKPFTLGRILLQGTPFRARVGLRCKLLGHTYLNRDRWICSELVVAALTAAGVLNPREFPANGMYPRDLAFDDRYDLSCFYHPAAPWVPERPQAPDMQALPQGPP